MKTANAATSPSDAPENQPRLGPCEMKTLIASIAITKVMTPAQSKPRWWPASVARDSGVLRIR